MNDLLNFPAVRQSTGYTCGVASLEAALAFYGIDSREDKLAKELGAEPPNGVTPAKIVEVARRHGAQVTMREGLSVGDLAKLLGEGHPVLIVVQAWPDKPHPEFRDDWIDGHYIVAIGVDDSGRFEFMDPSLAGRSTTMTPTELLDRWHDRNKGHDYDHLGIIFSGTPADRAPIDEGEAEREWRQQVQTDPNTPTAKSHLTTGSVHVNKPVGEEKSNTPGRDRPDSDFDADELERGIKREMSEHGVDRATARGLVKDHLAEGNHYPKEGGETVAKHSPEFYQAFHGAAKKMLQPWQHDQIHRAAVPSAGGRAGRRRPEHSAIEEALLKKLSSEHLTDLDDGALQRAWDQLETWHKLASRKNMDTGDYESAAEKIADELDRRGTVEIDQGGHLAQVVLAKSAGIELATMDDIVSLMAARDGWEPLMKSNPEKGIIWYCIGCPWEEDTEGHRITADEVEAAAHRYVENGCPIGIEHGLRVGMNARGELPEILPRERAVCVESGLTLAPTDKIFGQQLPRVLPERSWYVANKYIDPKLREIMMHTTHGGSWRGPAKKVDRITGVAVR